MIPLEDRTMLRIANPRTDNGGDGVGANTSSLTVFAKSFSTHRRSHFTLLHSSSPTCEQIDLSGEALTLSEAPS